MANGQQVNTRPNIQAPSVPNYSFGDGSVLGDSPTIKRGQLGLRQVAARRTWSEKTGYSFSRHYEGHHVAVDRGFDNPSIVCGANQVVANRNYASEKATLDVSFSHRTVQESRANWAQPEEYKEFWGFEPQQVEIPIWRHSAYVLLNFSTYVSGVFYPLTRQIWMAANHYRQMWESRYQQEVTEEIIRIPVPNDVPGRLQLNRPFDIMELVRAPSEFGLFYPDDDDATRARKIGLMRELGRAVFMGKTHVKEYRYVLKQTAVVPSNASVTPALQYDRRLLTSAQIAWLVRRNVYFHALVRRQTPAACRPIFAPRLSLSNSLTRSPRFAQVLWRGYPGRVTEINNGSIEITRFWEEQFDFEIDYNITPLLTDRELVYGAVGDVSRPLNPNLP